MKRTRVATTMLLLALGCWSCSSDRGEVVSPGTIQSVEPAGPEGVRYYYTGYNLQRTKIVKGFMTIVFADSNRISGEWQFEATVDPKGIGPQVGAGRLVGGFEGRNLWIGLNPDYADNNVMLSGVSSGTSISGTWQYVGFPGVLAGGTFRAVRLAMISPPVK